MFSMTCKLGAFINTTMWTDSVHAYTYAISACAKQQGTRKLAFGYMKKLRRKFSVLQSPKLV